MRHGIRVWLAVAAALGGVASAPAALTTQSLAGGITPEQLGNAIVGTGVAVSNVSVRGCAAALGTFAGGAGVIGLDTGLVLSSGNVGSASGPNQLPNVSLACQQPGDPDLNELVPQSNTTDAAALEFDFVPSGDRVAFRYVFASDEYDEFVDSQFNDVFGFFVNGVNLALLPGTNETVAVNNVNASKNGLLFVDNDAPTGPVRDTEADGLTQVLTFTAPVLAGQPNHIKLVIADTADAILDSWIFIGAESLSATTADVGVTVKGTRARLEIDVGATGKRLGVAEAAGFALVASSPAAIVSAAGGVTSPPGLTAVTKRARRNVNRRGHAKLRLRLTRGGKKLLKQTGSLQVLVVARVTGRDGRSVEFQRLVELRR